MTSRHPMAKRAPRSVLAALVLVAAVSGCNSSVDPYPTSMRYPNRGDLLVVSIPSEEPYYPDDPGQLDQSIAQISSKSGGKTLDPKSVPQELRNKIGKELEKVFGTPARPTVVAEDSDVMDQVVALKLADVRGEGYAFRTLAEGSRHYRRNCLHCHGLPGDGRGPTGPWLNPHPRDYRQGLFKFISTDVALKGRRPRRVDLLRTLQRGIDGTSMPSFGLEAPDHLEELVSYVMHLSLRGEVEFDTLKTLLENGNKESALEGGEVAGHITTRVAEAVKRWADSAEKVNQPPAYTVKDDVEDQRLASVRRGYVAFTDEKKGNCVKCHIDFGRQSRFRYDEWGTFVRPNNLTGGIYRGGRRPVDIYWRVRGGIVPSGMPPANELRPDEAWDVVNFVLAMPYPQMLPDDIKAKVYPPSAGGKAEQHAQAD